MGNQAAFYSDRGQVDGKRVRAWFSEPVAVAHYARAATTIGLWESEKKVFGAVFDREKEMIDVGCGAGRVTLGLWELGFHEITGLDFCEPLVSEAQRIAEARGARIAFEVGDAMALPFPDDRFDGVVFAFNGLMQIPGRANRRKALTEMRRVGRAGAHLVFTAHDFHQVFGTAREGEAALGAVGPDGREVGDRVLKLPEGKVFMHIPSRREVMEDLQATGWRHLEDHTRSSLANESQAVRDFSDECRFWIACRLEAD